VTGLSDNKHLIPFSIAQVLVPLPPIHPSTFRIYSSMEAISVTYASLNTLAWIKEILFNLHEIPAHTNETIRRYR
jgi:hypothetical protein